MKTIKLFSVLVILIFTSDFSNSQSSISIRLGSETGQDCNVDSYIPNTPLPEYPDIVAATWTYGGEFNLWRPLFKFNLTEVPSGSVITGAYLSLYANPTPCSAPHSGANKSYIRRVTSPWDQNTVTWETQPDFSTVNQAELHESTSPAEDYLNIDVTEMVKDMVANPATNFGFVIMNRFENIYRSINFASSECAVIDKRPKLDIIFTRVGIEPVSSELPRDLKLSQNFPNPFNPVTTIKFDLPASAYTKLKIIDGSGREISTLVNENLNTGSYQVKWDGSNYSSGAYFIRLESGSNIITKKMMLVK